ncbi:linear amide C-N hydrolase [Vibrio mediterranei]|uniref:linear amide C-N hydrolase n=1 Tax=Vibrio TaxID=662 RepID=UPI0017FF6D4C|nr:MULTISPECIES: linear amide C-N hydrolase [Vibrio]MDA0106864.1 linear amide C-N hydrolase [Vibrio sp. La 4.2.2]NUW74459.1 linear amide C-N hydrolase [Vibrio mediterranei]USE02960.1 linear amide C-N hydrolase [Vibrio sp. SCSIO 43133]
MKKSILTLLLTATTSGVIVGTADACTYATFEANDKSFVARTMELPFEAHEMLTVVPRGHEFAEFTAKYGFVGMQHGQEDMVSSGINEHGVSVEALALGAADYLPAGKGDISQIALGAYILGNARSTDEAVTILHNLKVHLGKMAGVGAIGVHLAINDGERKVVVEHTQGDGIAEIYENDLGVMTNDPVYPVQVELAQMMLDGKGYDDAKVQFAEETFKGFDRSPTGRFQQMVALNATQDSTRIVTDFDAVNRAWSMINSVDVVQGTLYWRHFDPENPQMTGYSNVTDINNKDYYFRTYDNQQIRKVDIDTIDFANTTYKQFDIFRTIDGYQVIDIN